MGQCFNGRVLGKSLGQGKTKDLSIPYKPPETLENKHADLSVKNRNARRKIKHLQKKGFLIEGYDWIEKDGKVVIL